MIYWIIWGLAAGLFTPVFIQLYKMRWVVIDYHHAYFILPVFLLFLFLKRKELADALKRDTLEGRKKPGIYLSLTSGFLLLIAGLAMFVFGWKLDYMAISTFSLIPILFGLTLYLYGMTTAKTMAFPILYLLLLVPPPLGILDKITIPMRYGISIASESLLTLLRIPITRDGLLLSVSGHEIYMGAACSGFRSLITMLSLGLAYVYLIKTMLKNKIILVISVVPIALLGNLLRVSGLCFVTYKFGEDAGHKFHDTSGLIIFVILISGLMGIESLLERMGRRKR